MLGLPGLLVLLGVWIAIYVACRWLGRQGVWAGSDRDVLALGVLLLVVIAFYWPLFFTESWIPKGGGDLSSFIYPTYAYAARWLKRGVVPLWNPHLYMGMPFAADNQSGLFYPINLLFFFLTSELTYEAIELLVVTHVFLAGLFAYILIRGLPAPGRRLERDREHRMGRVASLAGAIVYMLSDLYVIHPGNLNIIATAAWLPLALALFRRSLIRSSWGAAAWSGVVLGIAALVGHAQMFLYVGMTLGLFALFEVYVHRSQGLGAGALRLGRLLFAGVVAFGVSAISLLPAFDMTRYTVRATMSYAEASAFALPPAGVVGLVVPGFWGRATGEFWGPWARTDMGYAGVLTLVLAAAGVALTWRRYSLTRFCALLALLGLLVALGSYTVLHGWLYALVPMFRQLRVPARAVVLLDFGLAVLAAVGLDTILHPLTRAGARRLDRLVRGLVLVAGVVALFVAPLLAQAQITTRMSAEDVRVQVMNSMGSVIFFLVLLGGGIAILLLRRHRLARRSLLGALAVFWIAFDLISLGVYVEIEPNDPLEGYDHDDALAFFEADPDVFRVETAAEVQGGWAPDWALLYEMDDWGGIWNPLRLGAYDVLTWVGIQRQDRFYDLYNVKYLIARQDTPVPDHFEPVLADGARMIYENTHVLPRAFVVHRAQVVGGDIQSLHIARSPEFDLAREVVLKKDGSAVPLEEEDVDPVADAACATVELLGRGPNHLDFRVSMPARGYLFVSEMWLPGWTAWVDGVRAEVHKANYTFRAVYLEPGVHEVQMVYRPPLWPVGLGTTLVTLAALSVWGLVALARGQARKNLGSVGSVAQNTEGDAG